VIFIVACIRLNDNLTLGNDMYGIDAFIFNGHNLLDVEVFRNINFIMY
jgi:hypothetical protein